MRYLKYFFNRFYYKSSRNQKKLFLFSTDIFILAFAWYLSFFMRLEFFLAWNSFIINWQIAVFLVILQSLLLYLLGVYRSILLYSFHITVLKIFQALSLVLVFLLLITPFYINLFDVIFPRLILIFQYFIALFLLSSWRFFIFNFVEYIKKNIKKEKKEIILFGAGTTGVKLLQVISEEYKVIAFIDDKKELQKQTINGIIIISLQAAENILKKNKIHKIIITIPSLSPTRLTEFFNFLKPFPVSIETIYNITDNFYGKKIQTRNITIEDLIGRNEIQPNQKIFIQSIQGKTILITGAGGSIGLSLCKIIMRFNPQLLILLDISEIALYKTENTLTDAGFHSYKSYLCDVCSAWKIKEVFENHNIDTVYHTAAYKHVNIIEHNPVEGIAVNIFGTCNIAQYFLQSSGKNFVLISTDKAVNPTSIMGKTKKIAELAIRSFGKFEKSKVFTIVRFGNVLNSSGSVVPRFTELIEKKKNLTVTHKEATRYFMSLLEAASLVIQAGELSHQNEIFHLDMGKPIKIYDLAYNLIRLYGYQPQQDIKIKIGKLMPGEKIHEENLIPHNGTQQTEHPKIFKIQESQIPREIFDEYFLKLKYFSKDNDTKNLLLTIENILSQVTEQK